MGQLGDAQNLFAGDLHVRIESLVVCRPENLHTHLSTSREQRKRGRAE
jgi:hypothetical protein